jgi:Holliday junction resolvasome RuvABC endonuclease subunit
VITTTGLERFAAVPAKGRKAKEPWAPPTRADFKHGCVLAFDQSFSATGWVHLSADAQGPYLLLAGSFRVPEGDHRGAERDLDRADWLRDQVSILIDQTRAIQPPQVVLYEMPPIGPHVRSPEVSLLCACGIRNAAHSRSLETRAVHTQTGKRLVTGNNKADKKTTHEALDRLGPDLVGGYSMITNESKRDALLVALAYLKRSA